MLYVFLSELGLSVVRVGDSQVFEFVVAGTPEISLHWYRNGAEISIKHKMSFIHAVASLEICQVGEDDSGNYFCKARNEAGTWGESERLFFSVSVILKLSMTSRIHARGSWSLIYVLFQSLLHLLKS